MAHSLVYFMRTDNQEDANRLFNYKHCKASTALDSSLIYQRMSDASTTAFSSRLVGERMEQLAMSNLLQNLPPMRTLSKHSIAHILDTSGSDTTSHLVTRVPSNLTTLCASGQGCSRGLYQSSYPSHAEHLKQSYPVPPPGALTLRDRLPRYNYAESSRKFAELPEQKRFRPMDQGRPLHSSVCEPPACTREKRNKGYLGPTQQCTVQACANRLWRNGKCRKHCVRIPCREDTCENTPKVGGYCSRHSKVVCSEVECVNKAQTNRGLCAKHLRILHKRKSSELE